MLKNLTKEQATILGHCQQPQKGLQSTQKKELQSEQEPVPDTEPDQLIPYEQSEGTNLVFLKTVDFTGKFYTDQTGRFLLSSRKGNK